MKALYIELAVLWALIAFLNFAFYAANGSWLSLFGGVGALLSFVAKVYSAGKES